MMRRRILTEAAETYITGTNLERMLSFYEFLTESRTNPKFDAALKFVRTSLPHLFHPSLRGIQLVEPDGRAHGRFWTFTLGRDSHGQLVKRMQPTITIANNRKSTADFVATIAHELTHLQQYVAGRPFSEGEAMSAGHRAKRQYLESR